MQGEHFTVLRGQLGPHRLALGGVAHHQVDVGSQAGELAGGLGPEARRGAGDQGVATGQGSGSGSAGQPGSRLRTAYPTLL